MPRIAQVALDKFAKHPGPSSDMLTGIFKGALEAVEQAGGDHIEIAVGFVPPAEREQLSDEDFIPTLVIKLDRVGA